jgi:hypothetical protein
MQSSLFRQPVRRTAASVRRSGPPMFVFGIGAVKAGTTWLYSYLRAHRECHLRGQKELQYFDAIEQSKVHFHARRLAAQIRDLQAQLPRQPKEVQGVWLREMLDMRDYHRVLMTCHADKNAYFRYMLNGLGQQRLVADITPNYSTLSTDMLGRMVGVAEETRFIYLMRDPVARFWSNLRMGVALDQPPGADIEGPAKAELAQILDGKISPILDHSDYAHVLEKMETAIPKDRRLVMFYEDLPTPGGVRRLCAFLGIKPMAVDFAHRINEGQDVRLTDGERAAIRRLLRPQYEAVAARFPVLPRAWQATMAEGFE